MTLQTYTDVILTVSECQQIVSVLTRSSYPINKHALRSAIRKVEHGARVSLLVQSSDDTSHQVEGAPVPGDSVEMSGGGNLAFEFGQT